MSPLIYHTYGSYGYGSFRDFRWETPDQAVVISRDFLWFRGRFAVIWDLLFYLIVIFLGFEGNSQRLLCWFSGYEQKGWFCPETWRIFPGRIWMRNHQPRRNCSRGIQHGNHEIWWYKQQWILSHAISGWTRDLTLWGKYLDISGWTWSWPHLVRKFLDWWWRMVKVKNPHGSKIWGANLAQPRSLCIKNQVVL